LRPSPFGLNLEDETAVIMGCRESAVKDTDGDIGPVHLAPFAEQLRARTVCGPSMRELIGYVSA